ncbi:hypothetical protein F2P81_007602 [Scophthalmus maximus]|uniref:Uncharacterized protein n=1 Tax=Scophthalmus maximus TaxID=52904 RepID=A0A6A4T046_SCOMX|nr:hypothetical protein F2P81_007602 [Scophthalmus maximus]
MKIASKDLDDTRGGSDGMRTGEKGKQIEGQTKVHFREQRIPGVNDLSTNPTVWVKKLVNYLVRKGRVCGGDGTGQCGEEDERKTERDHGQPLSSPEDTEEHVQPRTHTARLIKCQGGAPNP